jgi:protein-S-isoprenylcysteine O-methyltransferase Ste14
VCLRAACARPVDRRKDVAALELKVPPILLGPVAALLMWPVSVLTPRLSISPAIRILCAVMLCLPAVLLVVLAYVAFGRERTSPDARVPEKTSALVTSGAFAYTRNPMYLSLLLMLLAVAVGLSSPVALLLALGFALYIDRFQIVPEERALRGKFGSQYEEYLSRVRRWA